MHQTCILGYSRLVLKMEVIDLDLQGHFDLEFLEIWLVSVITYNGFELESPNLHQICIFEFSELVLKMEVIDIDLQGLAIVSTQETAFNVALVYWSRPTKGCYTSQTCSCTQYTLMEIAVVPFLVIRLSLIHAQWLLQTIPWQHGRMCNIISRYMMPGSVIILHTQCSCWGGVVGGRYIVLTLSVHLSVHPSVNGFVSTV